ncbi:hypothetical protein niasHS_010279 [Heterodera schachtii]|uniref:Protein Red n=1 Tax=Heterodera schachtii TaxID=97005 RepID=A0ABD2J4H2_HETSC
MNNDDFRKLLAVPASVRSSHSSSTDRASVKSSSVATFTHRQVVSVAASNGNVANKKAPKKRNFANFHREKPVEGKEEDDLFDESQARLNEIMKNYRDRAAERRKGVSSTDDEVRQRLTAGAYKAVPGNFLANSSLEETRRIEIQKSKYLGGDMEHTHLVKGLDYSLLNKVRTEILERDVTDKDQEQQDSQANAPLSESSKAANSKLAANICKLLFENKPPKRNELFARGRMAYVVELEDEETDVPSTLLRSVVDCPLDQSSENINADNLLINKLTQVLAYLRTDVKKRRKGAGDGTTEAAKGETEASIFEGLEEYEPSKERQQETRRGREEGQQKRTTASSYFDTDNRDSRSGRDERDRRGHRETKDRERKREREKEEPTNAANNADTADEQHLEKLKKRRMEQEDAYAEFYPGGIGMLDAGGESDDEADYTQMDMGNRKGPVKRWDFESQDDYERYQSAREANPKAAYQFGVKTSGGRKTRKSNAAAKERKLDRELEKISKIWDSRSGGGGKSGGGKETKVRY